MAGGVEFTFGRHALTALPQAGGSFGGRVHRAIRFGAIAIVETQDFFEFMRDRDRLAGCPDPARDFARRSPGAENRIQTGDFRENGRFGTFRVCIGAADQFQLE